LIASAPPSTERITAELPGSGGVLLRDPADFEVREVLPYAPSGQGEHLFVEIEKVGLTTAEAASRVGRALGLREGSWAGMKDRSAVASQWLSFPLPIARALPVLPSELDGVRVLQMIRHGNKLRRGHQRGNRFRIVIRSVPAGGIERALACLDLIQRTGVPNRFGPQRFGRDQENVARGIAVICGASRPPRDRKQSDFLISAVQSAVFNRALAIRIERGFFARALLGDVMQKHDTGGLFDVTDASVEQERVDRLEISPTAVMPGKRARACAGEMALIEHEAVRSIGLSEGDFAPFADGTRRVLRFPLDPSATITPIADDAYALEVMLPSGAYATVLLDEIVKPEGVVFDREG
jgi:tRNA pseudouridine13 synthase